MSKQSKKYRNQKRDFLKELSGNSHVSDVFAQESARAMHTVDAREANEIKRSCMSKNRYACKSDAQATIFACEEHGTTGLKCYKCPYCNGWHLTSHPWADEQ